MDKSKYLKAVRDNLNCSKAKKAEISMDLEADINSALDGNGDEAEVLKQMGDPIELAREFNLNMGLPGEKKSRKKIWIIAIVVILVIAACIFAMQSRVPKQYEMGETGLFTEESVAKESKEIVDLLYKKNFDVVLNQYGNDQLNKQVNAKTIEEAMKNKGENWGDFKKLQSQYFAELKQKGQYFAITEMTVLYDNVSVTYTLSFDEDMKLAGIFIK